jgi:acylpyruvate hydrolase
VRLVTFTHDGRTRIGALRLESGAEQVVDLTRVDPNLPTSMRSFLDAGEPALERAAAAVGESPREAVLARSRVKLGPVIPDPTKLICIGLNYRDHAAETKQDVPEVPTVFAKYPNVLIGAGDAIVIPPAPADHERQLRLVVHLASGVPERGDDAGARRRDLDRNARRRGLRA